MGFIFRKTIVSPIALFMRGSGKFQTCFYQERIYIYVNILIKMHIPISHKMKFDIKNKLLICSLLNYLNRSFIFWYGLENQNLKIFFIYRTPPLFKSKSSMIVSLLWHKYRFSCSYCCPIFCQIFHAHWQIVFGQKYNK